ncbi:MAG: type II toxin-antitoxin system PemK/MazF family toxin [Candidatus Taylorbacteria bacterium]|nr:type II toxin-antitoxin system PemK/MazF family toxin [Candidatus Taylorbacteria bacterium]
MTEYIKDFDKWNKFKKAVNSKTIDLEVFFHEREIWWCSLGVNIGSEEDGKNESFERPVLIVRKINKDKLLITPFTSKIVTNDLRITASCAGIRSQILLDQIRIVSSRRLLRRIGYVKMDAYQKVIIGITRLVIGIPEGETPP